MKELCPLHIPAEYRYPEPMVAGGIKNGHVYILLLSQIFRTLNFMTLFVIPEPTLKDLFSKDSHADGTPTKG